MIAAIPDFWQAVLSGLLVNVIVVSAGYFVVERRLKLREDRANRVAISRDILKTVHDELAHNREVAASLIEHLPQGALPYLGFQVNGWTLIAQVPAFTALGPATIKSLLDAYLRFQDANEQHSLLLDFTYGSTGTLAFLIATSSPSPDGKTNLQRLEERRDDLRKRLLVRVTELKPHVDVALSTVQEELDASLR